MRLLELLRDLGRRLLGLGRAGSLCDTCRYDYGDACSRPERPNARSCPDYKRR